MTHSETNTLSIIIPAYNEELWIERTIKCAINSCIEAKLKEFEILVINDASTDRTSEIAKKSGAHIIDVYNRNIAKNKNLGASKAKFKTLLFLDADSIVSGKDIRRSLKLLDMGVSSVIPYIRYDSFIPLYTRILCYIPSFFISCCNYAIGGGGMLFIYKLTFENVGRYNESLFSMEDADIYKRLTNRAFIHTDGYTSSRRYVRNGFISGFKEFFSNLKYKESNTWYKPNYREPVRLEKEIFGKIPWYDRLYRYLCPEINVKDDI